MTVVLWSGWAELKSGEWWKLSRCAARGNSGEGSKLAERLFVGVGAFVVTWVSLLE